MLQTQLRKCRDRHPLKSIKSGCLDGGKFLVITPLAGLAAIGIMLQRPETGEMLEM